jgi:hypothetical protein
MHDMERKRELSPAVLGDVEALQPSGREMRADQMRRDIAPAEALDSTPS